MSAVAFACIALSLATAYAPALRHGITFPLVIGGTFVMIDGLRHVHHHIIDDGNLLLWVPFATASGAFLSHFTEIIVHRLADSAATGKVATNLICDALHNLHDGLLLTAATRMSKRSLKLSVGISVILHEVPQELADAYLMKAAGMNNHVIAFWNGLAASTVLLPHFFPSMPFMDTAVAAAIMHGAILYVAFSAFLIPAYAEIKRRKASKKVIIKLIISVALGASWAIVSDTCLHALIHHEH